MSFVHEPVDLGYESLKTQNVNGARMYVTPEGKKFPSVTSVLSVNSKQAIIEWRKRVGAEEANRISSFAASRGTRVHTMVERYLDNRDDYLEKSNPLTKANFSRIQKVLDQRLNKVVLQEAALFSEHLGLAGRVDCVGEFDNKLSIIDFKTSAKPKKHDYIHNYFMQETAYAIAFEERTGIPVSQLVTIIVNDVDDKAQVFIEKRDRWVKPLFDTIDLYYSESI